MLFFPSGRYATIKPTAIRPDVITGKGRLFEKGRVISKFDSVGIDSVKSMKVKRFNAGGTAGLVVGSAALAVLFVYAIVYTTSH